MRAAGSDAVLARYRAELGSAISHEIEGEAEQRVWASLRDFAAILPERFPQSLLIALSMPLAGVQPADDALDATEKVGLKLAVVGRIGVGHLLAGIWADESSDAATTHTASVVSKLRADLPQGCSVAILHRPEELQRQVNAWGPVPSPLASMRAVKQALDPKDILNRGRFVF